MTVGDLIKELQTFKSDLEVVSYDDEYSSYIEFTEVNARVVHEVQNVHREIISTKSYMRVVV